MTLRRLLTMGHTVDVKQNVYTRASVGRRNVAVDALESKLPVLDSALPVM